MMEMFAAVLFVQKNLSKMVVLFALDAKELFIRAHAPSLLLKPHICAGTA